LLEVAPRFLVEKTAPAPYSMAVVYMVAMMAVVYVVAMGYVYVVAMMAVVEMVAMGYVYVVAMGYVYVVAMGYVYVVSVVAMDVRTVSVERAITRLAVTVASEGYAFLAVREFPLGPAHRLGANTHRRAGPGLALDVTSLGQRAALVVLLSAIAVAVVLAQTRLAIAMADDRDALLAVRELRFRPAHGLGAGPDCRAGPRLALDVTSLGQGASFVIIELAVAVCFVAKALTQSRGALAVLQAVAHLSVREFPLRFAVREVAEARTQPDRRALAGLALGRTTAIALLVVGPANLWSAERLAGLDLFA
jgi:hypothetical protein